MIGLCRAHTAQTSSGTENPPVKDVINGKSNILNALERGSLPFLTCEQTQLTFLLDSGASNSMVSINEVKPNRCFEGRALAGNDSPIHIYGEVKLNLKINGQTCPWIFQVADVRCNLIGCDFLTHFHFAYDFHSSRPYNVTDEVTMPPFAKRGLNWEYINRQFDASDAPEEVKELLREFRELIDEPIFTHF